MLVASGKPKLAAAIGLAVIRALLVQYVAFTILTRRRFFKEKACGMVGVTFCFRYLV